MMRRLVASSAVGACARAVERDVLRRRASPSNSSSVDVGDRVASVEAQLGDRSRVGERRSARPTTFFASALLSSRHFVPLGLDLLRRWPRRAWRRPLSVFSIAIDRLDVGVLIRVLRLVERACSAVGGLGCAVDRARSTSQRLASAPALTPMTSKSVTMPCPLRIEDRRRELLRARCGRAAATRGRTAARTGSSACRTQPTSAGREHNDEQAVAAHSSPVLTRRLVVFVAFRPAARSTRPCRRPRCRSAHALRRAADGADVVGHACAGSCPAA